MSDRRDRFDPELSELFGDDPELLRLAQTVRESRPEPVLDPRFPPVLRARLMGEARTALTPRRRFRVRVAPRGVVVWGTFAAGAAVAAAVVVVALTGQGEPAVVASNVSQQQAVDPHQAITLSFNEPMNEQNEAAVVAALKIQPATQVTVTWESAETLVLTPTHPLAANTDYQVTIPKTALQSAGGQTLNANVTIDFGTQAVATPGPSAPTVPALQPAAVGPAAGDGLAFWGPGNAPGVTDSTAGPTTTSPAATASPMPSTPASLVPSTTASPRPSTTPRSSPGSSPSSSPVPATPAPSSPATITPTPAPQGAVYFPTGQPPVPLSDTPATAVAVSPNGYYVGLAVTQADGTSTIVVENPDGSGASTLWPTRSRAGAPVTALAWDGNTQIVFVTQNGIYAVDLEDQSSLLYAFPAGGSASGVVLSADGQHAFLPAVDVSGQPGADAVSPVATASPSTPPPASAPPSPSASPSGSGFPSPAASTAAPTATYLPAAGDGWLVTIPSAGAQLTTATQLPGSSGGVVAFSGAGDEVAWVDASGSVSSVLAAPVSNPTAITPLPGGPPEGIQKLALGAHGATVAYALAPGGIEVETAGGAVLGTTPDEASSLEFSADGTQLAFVAAGSLDVAQVQSSSTPSGATSLCADAGQALTGFVDDQVAHDEAGLAALSAPGAGPAGTLTPASIDRGYVISSSCTAATATVGPTLTASARLIVDPKASSPAQITDETVVLSEGQAGWLVTGLTVPPLHAASGGPQVLAVSATPPVVGSINPESVVTVTFDADLDPASVTASSLWLETSDGETLSLVSPPAYDPSTRQATLIVAGSLPAGSEVVVGTSMADIDGGHPAANAVYPVGA